MNRHGVRRVLHVAAEMSPYASTGGLGEVVGSLPAALSEQGWESTVLLPRYPGMPAAAECVWSGTVELGRAFAVRVLEAEETGRSRLWLLECGELFERDGIYGDARGLFPDNEVRFAVLSRVAVRLLREVRPGFQALHAHDWHAAPAAVWARDVRPAIASVLTVHNHAYRGEFPVRRLAELGLRVADPSLASFLECGILAADAVTTVSPAYAREIAASGGAFAQREDPPRGIVNGLDVEQWDPSADARLTANFDADSLERRAENRSALESELGFAHEEAAIAAFQGRFAFQKGLDVLLDAAPRLLDRGLRLVLHGDGDAELEARARALASAHPGRIVARIGFDRDFSARMLAGIDVLIMPSRFEPCGLSQLQAMRYGAIPLVHATGGLEDTVHPLGQRGHRASASNGFWMKTLTPRALSLAMGKVLKYLAQPEAWRTLQRNGMTQDVSWTQSAQEYARLYEEAVEIARARDDGSAGTGEELPSVEPEAGFALEGPPLPEQYGHPTVHLVAQAPRMLYAYWEIPHAASLRLWLEGEGLRREVATVQGQGEAWIPVDPDRPYAVGLEDGDGRELLRSERVHAPAEPGAESAGDPVPPPVDRVPEPPAPNASRAAPAASRFRAIGYPAGRTDP